jgi:3-methyladenine DNA glycosylase AlkC
LAEPFKNLLNAGLVHEAAQQLARHAPGFDHHRFATQAAQGLEALEMKARAMQIADALEATLPPRFADAADVLEAALAPAEAGDAMAQLSGLQAGLRGWILWPVGEFVARRGLAEPERALQALHAMTQRFTAEFAIRPFIVAHPALVFDTLARWAIDPSHHVRRLVSEGSRPRLPWGLQLKSLIHDPSPTLTLLHALQDDPSEYVRRSVANHLNDIAKDHPARVAQWLHEHLPGAPAERRALLRHASRTLIKAGDAAVMQAWGLGRPLQGEAALTVTPKRITLGEVVTLTLRLRSTAASAQQLAIDYAVHHVRADGSSSAKVFKGWAPTLPGRGEWVLDKRHAVRPITTRRYHAGWHRVVVQVNGQAVAEAGFELVVPRLRSG